MFTHFSEWNRELVVLKQIDSTSVQLLTISYFLNFIYHGEILVREKNIQVMIHKVCFYYIEKKSLKLFISQGFVTSCRSLEVTRCEKGMLRFCTDTALPY